MDSSPPGSSVHEILQARVLERVAIPFSRGSSRPRDWSCIFRIASRFLTTEPSGQPSEQRGAGNQTSGLGVLALPLAGFFHWESDSHLLTVEFSHMYSWSNKSYFMRLDGELNHISIWKHAPQHPTNKPCEIYARKTDINQYHNVTAFTLVIKFSN